jgi:hypothetical protein
VTELDPVHPLALLHSQVSVFVCDRGAGADVKSIKGNVLICGALPHDSVAQWTIWWEQTCCLGHRAPATPALNTQLLNDDFGGGGAPWHWARVSPAGLSMYALQPRRLPARVQLHCISPSWFLPTPLHCRTTQGAHP